MKPKNFRIILGAALVAIGAGLIGHYYFRTPKIPELSRTKFQELVNKKSILGGTLTPTTYAGIYSFQGTFRVKKDAPIQKFRITTHLDEKQVQGLIAQSKVKMEVPDKSSKAQWLNLVSTIIIAVLIISLISYQMNIGKGRTPHRILQRPRIRFDDVAGIEEAKTEVHEVVDFLRNPTKYRHLGGKIPKGILLIGPPGTGKTMLAKAIAGEADANFFSAHGSDFNEVFVGVGAKRVRELFNQAAKNKPSIIFIDEIDCVGRSRKMDNHGEQQQTINALLAAMDGFENNEGIVVVAATNRPEDLDDALMRPGRFDRKVFVPYPDRKGRRAILQSHTRNTPIHNKDTALDVLAQTTAGMSGADLASVLNEAAILCAQQEANHITLSELEQSRDKVRFGKERKSMVLNPQEREMVAYHEAGHALINLQKTLLPPLYKVSIVPRGNALGVTTLLPQEDQNIHSRNMLLEELVVLMGGRAAEKVFYGATTNGASGDLDTAKKVARRMIHEWGMGKRLYYELEQQDAELEINELLENADREALSIIQAQKEHTKKLADALLARETLTRDEVVALLEEGQLQEK
jgi:cell division protease FtsH